MPITRDYNAVFGGSQTAQMPEQPSVGAQRFYGNGVPVNQGNPNLRLRTPDELRRYGEIRQSPDRGLLRSVWEWAYYDMGGLITQVWDEKAKMLMEHNLSASGEPMNDKEMMSWAMMMELMTGGDAAVVGLGKRMLRNTAKHEILEGALKGWSRGAKDLTLRELATKQRTPFAMKLGNIVSRHKANRHAAHVRKLEDAGVLNVAYDDIAGEAARAEMLASRRKLGELVDLLTDEKGVIQAPMARTQADHDVVKAVARSFPSRKGMLEGSMSTIEGIDNAYAKTIEVMPYQTGTIQKIVKEPIKEHPLARQRQAQQLARAAQEAKKRPTKFANTNYNLEGTLLDNRATWFDPTMVRKTEVRVPKPKSKVPRPKGSNYGVEETPYTTLYSGIPYMEMAKFYGGTAKSLYRTISDTAKNLWWNPPGDKELSAWFKHMKLPHWVAKKFPNFRRVYHIEMSRQELRASMSEHFLSNIEDFFKMKGKDYDDVVGLLVEADKHGTAFSGVELLEAGYSPEVVNTFNKVRSTLDSILEDNIQRMRKAGVPEDEINKLRHEMGRRPSYLPRNRYGKFFVRAERNGPEGKIEKGRWHFDRLGRQKLMRDLESRGWRVTEEGVNTNIPDGIFAQISPEDISAVFDVATEGWDDIVRDQLRRNIADSFKDRSWMKHGIQRADEYIHGYETSNLKRVLFDYIDGYTQQVSKMEAGKAFRKELMDAAFPAVGKRNDSMFEYIKQYIHDVMMPDTKLEQTTRKIREAFFYKYLGLNIKSGIVNLTQNMIGAAPRLSLETRWAYPKLLKAMKDIAAYRTVGYKAISKEEARALRQSLNKGWSRANYMEELRGFTRPMGTRAHRIQRIVGGPMEIAERFNRESTFLAAFRTFRKQGLPYGRAIEKAGEVVEDSHFVYGKSNLPGLFRGQGNFGRLARPAYTFRTFTHNYVNLLSHMYGKDKKAVLKSLMAMFSLAGVSGIPLYKSLEAMAVRAGVNPRSALKELMEEHHLDSASDVVLYGLPAILGVDIGGSLSIELPGTHDMSSGTLADALGGAAVDIMGVPASIIEDTYNAGVQLYEGDLWRAIEESPITPMAVGNSMKAYREHVYGATTKSGTQIYDEKYNAMKLSPKQAVRKGVLGLQPVEKTEEYRKFQARKSESLRWQRKKKSLTNQFVKTIHRYGYGSKEADKMLEKIKAYNKSIPKYAMPIKSGDIKKRLRPKKRSKREEALVREVR